MKQTSTNTNLADSNQAIKRQAQINLDLVHEREAEKHADPNWTAVIVPRDNKTLAMKWVYNDSVNDAVL